MKEFDGFEIIDEFVPEENYAAHEAEYKKKDELYKTSISYWARQNIANLGSIFNKEYAENEFDPQSTQVYNNVLCSSDEDGTLAGEGLEVLGFDNRTPDVFSAGRYLEKVKNGAAFKKYKDSLSEYCDMVDDYIDDNVTADEAGRTTAEFLKANVTKQLRRAIKGYTPGYLASKSPLYTTAGSLAAACLEMNLFTVEDKIREHNKDFPVYDMSIESDKQMDTLVEYMEEKEKGKLTPEKTEAYRKEMYTQTLQVLNYINTIDNKVNNPADNARYKEAGITSSNQPFHMSTYANRGLGKAKYTQEAYKAGLENGWDLDDIGVLATFNMLVNETHNAYKHNSTDKMEKFQKYDPPRYKSPEQKAYLDKMSALFEEIKTTPLQSAKDRDKYLTIMNSMVKTAVKKEYIAQDETLLSYFDDVLASSRRRDAQIKKGNEKAFHTPQIKEKLTTAQHIDNMMIDFNSKRTDFYFGGESDRHARVRVAVDELKGMLPNKPNPKVDKGNYIRYMDEYINKLDEVRHYSRRYQLKRSNADTEAGKDRLRGASKLEGFAKDELNKAIEEIRKIPGYEDSKNMDDFRLRSGHQKALDASDQLVKLSSLPKDKETKAAMTDLIADIVVFKLASSENEANRRLYNDMGFNEYKKRVTGSSEFKNYIKNIYKQDMSPKDIVTDLTTEKVVSMMTNTEKVFEHKNKKLQEVANKKNQEKQARRAVPGPNR